MAGRYVRAPSFDEELAQQDLDSSMSGDVYGAELPVSSEGPSAVGRSVVSTPVPQVSANKLTPWLSFPKDVPTNRLWEEWRKYKENFEITASLYSVSDPEQLSKILYLSLGDQMQSIVRAARVNPIFVGQDCYSVFVSKVEDHLRSLTDTTSEHESFMAMHQEVGESAVAFHARLTERSRFCGYSSNDADRFIHSQLIRGLRDKEVAKSARLFNRSTNEIVQAATRNEGRVPLPGSAGEQQVLAVTDKSGPRNYNTGNHQM